MDDTTAPVLEEDAEPPSRPPTRERASRPGARRRADALVAVAFNRDFLPGGSSADALGREAGEETAEVAHRVYELLREHRIPAALTSVDDDPEALVAELVGMRAGRVVNLVESLGGDGRREHEVPSLLDAIGLPYTGNGPAALLAAQAKHVARRLMRAHDVRLAEGLVVTSPEDADRLQQLRFPLFVKPSCADGSVGIDQGAVVHDRAALRERLAWLSAAVPGPCLVETYLPGRELNVAIFPHPRRGGVVSVTEIDFATYPADYARIVTYDCKWSLDSPESAACSRPVTAASLGGALYAEVVAQARAAFAAIGGTSYGRVDLRLDAAGRPCVIDVNPNPDLHHEAGFAIAAGHAGFAWDRLVLTLLASASVRPPALSRPHDPVHTEERSPWTSPFAP